MTGPADVARLAAERGALSTAMGSRPDARPLAELAHALGACGRVGLLSARVVLPAVLLGRADVDGATTSALGDGDDDLALDVVTCMSRRDAATWRLTGVKPQVAGAMTAERLVAAVRMGSEIAIAEVDLDADGVQRSPVATLGRAGDADVRLDDVVVPDDRTVTGLAALERIERAATLVTLVQAAEGAGLLARLLELTVEQGRARYAFGRPLGSFQAFQHACADMAMERELADALVERAAHSVTAIDASRARTFASGAAVRAARTAVQLHGGRGFLDDSEVSRLYRLAKESQLRWGGPRAHLRRIAADLSQPTSW